MKTINGGENLNKKLSLIFSSFLVLVTVSLIFVSVTFAQGNYWDYCQISAYGTDLDDFSSSTVNTERFQITIAAPPQGSEITNTVTVMNYDTDENYTQNLSAGDVLLVDFQYLNPETNRVDSATETNYFIVNYEGEVGSVTINTVLIPEFPTILVVPLFVIATLIALAYRRKRI